MIKKGNKMEEMKELFDDFMVKADAFVERQKNIERGKKNEV